MTQDEWDRCTEPVEMLEALRVSGRASERKFRLIACGSCRLAGLLTTAAYRRAVETAERYADGLATDQELFGAAQAVRKAPENTGLVKTRWNAAAVETTTYQDAWVGAREAVSWIMAVSQSNTVKACLRDMFGPLLFRSINLPSTVRSWQGGTVVKLAAGVYQERDFTQERLGVLADAAEEAGLDDAELLAHLGSPGPHVRGCHVIDLLLGRE
jgi:hypothetical protein